ncbi:unnamed protein product [Agarophyton chilense]
MRFSLRTKSLPSVFLSISQRTNLWAAPLWLRTTKRRASLDTKWPMNASGTAMTIPSDGIRGQCVLSFCHTVRITALVDIATVLGNAYPCARGSVRYAAVVQQGQNLKPAMVNILQPNAQTMSQRVNDDLGTRYGPNLSDREVSDGDNSSSVESPPKKRARLAGADSVGPVGYSGDPSFGFAPARANENDGVTTATPQ